MHSSFSFPGPGDTPPGASHPHWIGLTADWYWEQDASLRFTRLLGAPADDSPARTHLCMRRWELPAATPLNTTWDEHRAVLAARRPFQDLQYRHAAGGRERCVSTSGEPIFAADGSFLGYRGTSRDITALWMQRERQQDTQTRLQLAAALGRFGAWSIDVPGGATTNELAGEDGLPGGERGDILQQYAPEYRAALRSAYMACARDGTPFDLDLEAVGPGGMRAWVRVLGVAVRDAAGAIVRVQGAVQDIHRTKQAAEEQRHLAEGLRNTLDSLADGFGSVDRDWRLTYANPMALRILGMEGPQVVGRSFWDVFPATRASVWEEHYRCAMEQGVSRRFEAYYAPLDLWLRVSTFPTQQGIAISFSDITAAVKSTQQLQRLNEELEARVRERTSQLQRINEELVAFTMAVSHDLRAPLAAIGGFTRAVADRLGDTADDKLAQYLARIQCGAARMDDQLQALVQLARLGQSELQPRALDLTRLARETYEQLSAAEPGRDAVFTVGDGLRADADESLVQTLLENLLGNAWKFSAHARPARIEFGRTADRAFYVRDNGAGFDMAYAQALFSPFRRLHDAGEFPGVGVGLASARRVVQRHGGRIWAESRPGAGATFFFTLG